MRIEDILTPDPFALPPSASVTEGMDLMDQHDFRHLPILDAGALVGVVSDRDLLEATGWKRNGVKAPDPTRPRTLGEIMHAAPTTLSPEDGVVTAALEMSLRRVGCLPVVTREGMVGIVTETDLARAFIASCDPEAPDELRDPQVDRLMTGNAMTVQRDTSLEEAVALARSTGVRHLPVLSGGRLVGMLSDRALRRAHGRRMPDDTHVSELMTADPVIVAPTQRVSVAAKRMLDNKISALPVALGDHVVGILTLTDVLDHCLENLR